MLKGESPLPSPVASGEELRFIMRIGRRGKSRMLSVFPFSEVVFEINLFLLTDISHAILPFVSWAPVRNMISCLANEGVFMQAASITLRSPRWQRGIFSARENVFYFFELIMPAVCRLVMVSLLAKFGNRKAFDLRGLQLTFKCVRYVRYSWMNDYVCIIVSQGPYRSGGLQNVREVVCRRRVIIPPRY